MSAHAGDDELAATSDWIAEKYAAAFVGARDPYDFEYPTRCVYAAGTKR